jgi:hypothetical protein
MMRDRQRKCRHHGFQMESSMPGMALVLICGESLREKEKPGLGDKHKAGEQSPPMT